MNQNCCVWQNISGIISYVLKYVTLSTVVFYIDEVVVIV
jgi:hypothetical protein